MSECQRILHGLIYYTEGKKMTEEMAKEIISKLTYEEKVVLNELLKSLERNRPRAESHPVSTE